MVKTVQRSRGTYRKFSNYIGAYCMLAPFMVLFILFIVVPVLWSLALSLTRYDIVRSMKWVGLENYKELFTDDSLFVKALKNTFIFAFITGPVGFVASFFFAWVINQLKMRNVFALAFYAPSILSSLAITVVWLYLFSSDQYGLVNNLLINLGVVKDPLRWTMDPKLIMPLTILISLWMSMGAGFLTNLAGLNNVPPQYYEAGQIDGIRNRFQEAVWITIPLMKPQLLFNAINSTVAAFAVYDIPLALVGFPSPDYSVHTIVAHMFDYAFTRYELGYASAIAVVLFVLNFGFGRIFMKMFDSSDEQ